MEEQNVTVKNMTIRCPECLNYMKAKVAKSGTYSGKCPVCKSSVFSKQYSERERHIRIVRNTAN